MHLQKLAASLCLLLSVVTTGCSINSIQHEGIQAPVASRQGTVTVADKASGFTGGKVGWGRLSPFAIPVAPVYIQGDESSQLMSNIAEALVLAGYQTAGVSDQTSGNGTVLHCNVEKYRFSNYTWLAPIVPTWGSVVVTLSLVNGDGDVLWSNGFDGGGFTLNFTDGYNIASRESMTQVLNKMVEAFTTDAFYQAVTTTPGAVAQEQAADSPVTAKVES